ncbi:hypothetical protein OH809_43680 [Streptomyces sp. NBC_00873]|uniref:hypothetical protein n=1 Tax=unclassified Streptomyces TaxID=2593676 RepID=UPI00386E0BDA|nr:hypothetical protein OH809_00030 [Streptomyces sp. NBC_00873]WSY96915.1 hypothetical protein OH809_43680 [Streptomyces sp. NBC_00873]WTA41312.1 hypothetical protein OH821_00030 [Streptomyces sp. NBC_00842]WTA48585.1 hypothetical protein OH821_43785 [Streptomyces sp. NBC_00842]
MAAFTDDMLHMRSVTAREVYGPDADDVDEFIERSLRGAGSVVSERLSLLDYTEQATIEFLDALLDDERSQSGLGPLLQGQPDPREEKRSYLAGYTALDWIKNLGAKASNPPSHEIGGASWLLNMLEYSEPGFALKAALLGLPDAEVVFILDGNQVDDVADDPDLLHLCSDAAEAVHAQSAAHAPIVVLTEGHSDVAILEPALSLLYPHLTDLVRFMDYNNNPRGGAGSLVVTVRAFAAARIANPVVALFDNDTGAQEALRPLAQSSLPSNIKILRCPPLELAKSYPTLGPPTAEAPMGRISMADVNGLAGSIELYLGRDVLSLPDGSLRPVQWRSYSEGSKQYQGEITDKKAVQQAYQEKLARAQADPSVIASQDWTGIRAILDMVIRAFD